MLPEDFHWEQYDSYPIYWLRCGFVVVATVNETVNRRWLSQVNRQRWEGKGMAYFPTRSIAQRMAEKWAMANADRLRRECADKRLRDPPAGQPQLSRAELRGERKIRR